jgi:hypothetical protein
MIEILLLIIALVLIYAFIPMVVLNGILNFITVVIVISAIMYFIKYLKPNIKK